MRITCPSCAAEYNVGAVLAEGRVVRCARCGHQWAPVAAPPAPDPPAPDPPAPDPPALFERPVVGVVEAPAPARAFLAVPSDARLSVGTAALGRNALALAWAGSVAVLVALVAAGYAFRMPIMQAWPPSTRLFAALGLG